jgi:hypothetical protein
MVAMSEMEIEVINDCVKKWLISKKSNFNP